MASLEIQVQKLFVKACVRPLWVQKLHHLQKPVETVLTSLLDLKISVWKETNNLIALLC